MSDVQMLDSPGTTETEESSDVEFADSAYPDSELVPDMLSKRAHRLLDEKVLQRYPWIDDEKADHSIYPRITLLRSLARDHNQPNPRLTVRYGLSGVRSYFEDHPWFVSVLNECWRKGSFRTIRLLSEYIWDTRNPSIDLPMFIDLFLHLEILQRPDVPPWELQESQLRGVSRIYIGLCWGFVDYTYSFRALMGPEIRGTSRICVALGHFSMSYRDLKLCKFSPFPGVFRDGKVPHRGRTFEEGYHYAYVFAWVWRPRFCDLNTLYCQLACLRATIL